jgi:hypothetical protein
LEMPSWRVTMAPGARFFFTSQRMYQTGGCKGSWGVGGAEDAFVAGTTDSCRQNGAHG